MIKKFEEFVSTIYEHQNRKDVKFNNKTKSEIYIGFKNLGYKCIGNFYWSSKSYNNLIPKCLNDLFYDKMIPTVKDIFGKDYKSILKFNNLDIDYYSKVYDWDNKFVYDCIINNISNEKVIKIKDNGNFYCFWNPTKKYYYYMSFKDRINSDIENIFDYYIFFKTEPVERVKEKLIELKKEKDEHDQETERIKKEYEEKERIKREKDEHRKKIIKEIDNIENSILQDAKENPDNYKKVDDYQDIPKNIQSQLSENDIEKKLNNDYFKTYKIIEYGRYDDGLAQFFINNRDLTDGYTYKTMISWSKPGTYYGD